jgi:hypothetical protein
MLNGTAGVNPAGVLGDIVREPVLGLDDRGIGNGEHGLSVGVIAVYVQRVAGQKSAIDLAFPVHRIPA